MLPVCGKHRKNGLALQYVVQFTSATNWQQLEGPDDLNNSCVLS